MGARYKPHTSMERLPCDAFLSAYILEFSFDSMFLPAGLQCLYACRLIHFVGTWNTKFRVDLIMEHNKYHQSVFLPIFGRRYWPTFKSTFAWMYSQIGYRAFQSAVEHTLPWKTEYGPSRLHLMKPTRGFVTTKMIINQIKQYLQLLIIFYWTLCWPTIVCHRH